VLLQPTSPLRSSSDIDGAIELLESSRAPACVTVRSADDHPYWTFYADERGCLAQYVKSPTGMPMRRQDLPEAWCLNGAVYAMRTEWFLRNRSILTADTVFYPMPAERSIDIDTPTDVERLIDVVQQMTRPSSNSQPNIAKT